MEKTYRVQRDGESLAARLGEEGERSVELTYKNAGGDTQGGCYINGQEISTRAILANGTRPFERGENTFLHGYLGAYDRLGPELRAQIPPQWHEVLGNWLCGKSS